VDFPKDVSARLACGLDIPSFWVEKDCARKSIASLNHPETKTFIRAASILGSLREKHAAASGLAKLFSIRGYHPEEHVKTAIAETSQGMFMDVTRREKQ